MSERESLGADGDPNGGRVDSDTPPTALECPACRPVDDHPQAALMCTHGDGCLLDDAFARARLASAGELERAMSAAESALASGDAAALGWQLALERITQLRAALEELAAVADRIHFGDPNLDPEEWYAIRDYAKKVLSETS